ncbi:toxin [Candidatus Roizmanbacteria bacterium RIFOXYB2_FULL_41_10]|uniref:Toxin n=1 Tax=Candidatus Roizmanbacteria bacterium RIFOXYA1_FULL_41_12 TaxID=1802082 RepID=A0A1F7KFD9_9BACT|nr:MAG: toxin [Candidatus Roizmanbacteria bacterium RIFOXYA1_FULL_41_12]OGK67811.1 MAG: toxin [Candidatus Roizmanbacteria bacterium RIFOXYA2_FULL_41_8]OGK69342.1 MAG: toxin [Candidatus Roizmanbacteria bacterium RIFOXYB2_FULL_41_10]OGK71138.1 MAG: toxin [Candidatus Roizmanbacteria bacterium RIFOXYC1_FULL_41_16]OGK74857.1 MAG: toxin [Candidatus Roizmanbacteria bacterium RIFOXYD1_FULL_41_24]OGK75971.1 MAG: toxin [Candidatus Roizmanbacteria bacterium RIFOXYC2_FULL_41_10]
MKYFDWSQEKNEQLKKEREISFEEVLIALSENRLLDILEHRDQKKYPGQRIMVININDYIFLVPFIEDENKIFLKTIIPSRKATKKYLIVKKTK